MSKKPVPSSRPAHNGYHVGGSSLKITAVGKVGSQEALEMQQDGRLLEMATLCSRTGAARAKYLLENNVGPLVSELSRQKGHKPIGVIRCGEVYVFQVVKHGQGNFEEIQRTKWVSPED